MGEMALHRSQVPTLHLGMAYRYIPSWSIIRVQDIWDANTQANPRSRGSYRVLVRRYAYIIDYIVTVSNILIADINRCEEDDAVCLDTALCEPELSQRSCNLTS